MDLYTITQHGGKRRRWKLSIHPYARCKTTGRQVFPEGCAWVEEFSPTNYIATYKLHRFEKASTKQFRTLDEAFEHMKSWAERRFAIT